MFTVVIIIIIIFIIIINLFRVESSNLEMFIFLSNKI